MSHEAQRERAMIGSGPGGAGGRKPKSRGICGVWIPESQCFCEEIVFSLRRCHRHYANLKKDGLWASLQSMDKVHRDAALDMLDEVQKSRPPYEYTNDEGERELMEQAAAQGESNGE